MITVVNQKHIRGLGLKTEYIGRFHPEFGFESPLANRYKVGRDGTAPEVIEKYRQWLLKEVRDKESAAFKELERLARLAMKEDVLLCCWCKPANPRPGDVAAPCHGDVVVRAIEYMIKRLTGKALPNKEPSSGGPSNESSPFIMTLSIGTLTSGQPAQQTYALGADSNNHRG